MYRCRCAHCGAEWEQALSPYVCLYCECKKVENITPRVKAPSWRLTNDDQEKVE